MVDTKQLSKEIRSLIKSASKAERDSIEEAIDESALSDNMKLKLHEELQVRLNESEQEVIDETVAAGKKDEARDLIDRKQEEINSEKDMRELPAVSAEVPKHKEIAVKTEEDMKKVQSGWEGKLVGYDPVAKIAKVLASVLILALMVMPVSFAAMTDEAVLGNDRWAVDSSGNLEPVVDGTLNLGAAANRVLGIYGRTLDLTGAVTLAGAVALNGANTLGDAVTDINTITGKIAGATPLTFDGATENTVYTILAVDDAASTSKTVTLPSVAGTVMLTGAATALTPGVAVALTVTKGNQLFTDTIVTDNEDQTITFSGAGAAGDQVTIIFVTDAAGSGDEIITFHGTLVRSTGTLTLANAAASRYVVNFISDGSKWNEVSRTAVQAA